MAEIQDRKKNFYSHKQSVREESLAPRYLESAGDVLVQNLARKQVQTRTTLEEQLKLKQNFERGFELNPVRREGVSSLEELKKHIVEENEKEFSGKAETSADSNETREGTGLSRHELELSLCEKPNSDVSKLYKFALRNQKKSRIESSDHRPPDHPINRLAEIEEEYFGHLKVGKGQFSKKVSAVEAATRSDDKTDEKKNKKRKRRKRKKKSNDVSVDSTHSTQKSLESAVRHDCDDSVMEKNAKKCRPSLWDVKDMKKWCEPKKEYGCETLNYYKVENGKIIKLDKFNAEDLT